MHEQKLPSMYITQWHDHNGPDGNWHQLPYAESCVWTWAARISNSGEHPRPTLPAFDWSLVLHSRPTEQHFQCGNPVSWPANPTEQTPPVCLIVSPLLSRSPPKTAAAHHRPVATAELLLNQLPLITDQLTLIMDWSAAALHGPVATAELLLTLPSVSPVHRFNKSRFHQNHFDLLCWCVALHIYATLCCRILANAH